MQLHKEAQNLCWTLNYDFFFTQGLFLGDKEITNYKINGALVPGSLRTQITACPCLFAIRFKGLQEN